jgi:hypothetical protein
MTGDSISLVKSGEFILVTKSALAERDSRFDRRRIFHAAAHREGLARCGAVPRHSCSLSIEDFGLVESFAEAAAAHAPAFQHRSPLVLAHSSARVCKGSDFPCEVSVGFLLNFCDKRGHKCGGKACQQITEGLPVGVPGVRARAGS